MLLWPERYGLKLLGDVERQATVEQLLQLQKPDGGWNSASLGNWERGDGQPQDMDSSDGYATGFALFILQQTGIKRTDERIARGLAWLESNQRASGRWHTRSLNRGQQALLIARWYCVCDHGAFGGIKNLAQVNLSPGMNIL